MLQVKSTNKYIYSFAFILVTCVFLFSYFFGDKQTEKLVNKVNSRQNHPIVLKVCRFQQHTKVTYKGKIKQNSFGTNNQEWHDLMEQLK